jgi:hypothetical protein
MHNEFTAIIEQDGDWFIAYVQRFQARMGKESLCKSVERILPKQSH